MDGILSQDEINALLNGMSADGSEEIPPVAEAEPTETPIETEIRSEAFCIRNIAPTA